MPNSPSDLPAPPRLLEIGCAALFLDLDGTLAAIEARPEDVGPEPWRTALLGRLQNQLDGRLAIISGRTLEQVDQILEGAVPAVAAVHGLVRRRPDGRIVRPAAHPAMAQARLEVLALAQAHAGLQVEDKGLSLAVHYRSAPELGALVRAQAETVVQREGLTLQLGDMVAEIRTPGPDKGSAVAAFMTEPPFARAQPLFVGDDLTDEAGFAAMRTLGGMGVLVGPKRPTLASRRLADASAVRGWLEASVLEGARG